MRCKKQLFLIFILASLIPVRSSAQAWIVPDDQKGKVAPFKFTPVMVKQGEQLYLKNCQSCHGLPGKNNWVRITPPPGDLSLEKAQNQSDGELFYRITNGRIPMPEFRKILSDEERWWLISFLRSFNPRYIQPKPVSQAVFTGKIIQLSLSCDLPSKKVKVMASEALKDSSKIPASGVEVLLFVKRYFGNLQIGDSKSTDKDGIVLFEFPSDLPGDKEGKVEILARVNDPGDQFKSNAVSMKLAIGVPTDKPSLIATKTWWTSRRSAPMWVIMTYSLSVIIVWGFIVYIVYNVLKIRNLNNKPNNQ
ncbi:MAG: cytochrome c [Bacteroidales bacterium]|jgi:mono/diheme cytochrome c family protein|nr:cytochrome c [Bacteroidales bacterium]